MKSLGSRSLGLAICLLSLEVGSIGSVAESQVLNTRQDQAVPPPPLTSNEADSASNKLRLADLDRFQPGRLMSEILAEIQWAGDLEVAAELNGKSVTVMSFYVYPYVAHVGTPLWAIFETDHFVKFVEIKPRDIKFPTRILAFDVLRKAQQKPAVVLSEFKRELEKNARPTPPDPALGAIFAAVKTPEILAKERKHNEATVRERNRFNAARLKLGMNKTQVGPLFGTAPIETGQLEGHLFEIYGSTEVDRFNPNLACSNTLALYREDRLMGFYSGMFAPGGQYGLNFLRKSLPNLEKPRLFPTIMSPTPDPE